ncbi:MAG TPA: hypothetical protein DCZ94_05105 [Lentisphaeria bacterium]|nr:MAG: hypothetical protein A2X48_07705 [Lentisphaerae bacterium GWF2_49_21]HBC86316.1 hypothetical protein [Lentisphaeria bacterium]
MQRHAEIEKAIERKYPEQVVLVTTRGKDGKANVMACGWTCTISGEPLMFILGIDDDSHTFELIRETKEFVVAYPHEFMKEETLIAGSCHGDEVDKIEKAGLNTQNAKKVKAPLISDAVANFECELVDIIKPGDCTLVLGKVIEAHVNTDSSLKRLCTVDKGHALSGVRPI